MKILHLLTDGPNDMSKKVIDEQAKTEQVKVVDISKKGVSYGEIVDEIFSSDRVVSW